MTQRIPTREVIQELTDRLETRGPEQSPDRRSSRRYESDVIDESSVELQERVEDGTRAVGQDGFMDEEDLIEEAPKHTCRSRTAACISFTYNFGRSVPLWTVIWSGLAVFSVLEAAIYLRSVSRSFSPLLPKAGQVFQYISLGSYYIIVVDSLIFLLSVLFTGWTLERLVQRHCVFDGFRGFCQRASFKSAQGAFFPLSYIGFIALTGALLGTGALAGFSLMANQACDSIARGNAGPAAARLSAQLSKALHWAFLPAQNISGASLAAYCSQGRGPSTGTWRAIFLAFGVALFSQVNLTLSTWTMILKTGFQIQRNDMERKFEKERAAKVADIESSRPVSRRLSYEVSKGRPASVSRPVSMRITESKEGEDQV